MFAFDGSDVYKKLYAYKPGAIYMIVLSLLMMFCDYVRDEYAVQFYTTIEQKREFTENSCKTFSYICLHLIFGIVFYNYMTSDDIMKEF